MADFQPQGQNWSGQNPVIGTGEGEVPLAKPPIADLSMRTMGSDISSMKESGGGEPRPYAPKEVSYSAAPAPMAPAAPQAPRPAPGIPPQVDFGNIAPAQAVPIVAKPSSGNALFVVLAALITAVGLAAVGYFFIYPQFAAPAAPLTTEQPAAPVEQPAVTEPTTTAPAATTTAAATSTATAPVAPEAPQLPTVSAHTSLLKTPADFSSEATLSSVTLDAIKTALASSPVEVPVLREITLKNDAGKVYAFSVVAPLFMPSVFSTTTLAFFSPDASIITYTDKAGTWPAFVLQLASGADATAAKAAIAKIEAGQDYISLYSIAPGSPTSWKDGKVGTAAARYIAFSTKGVAFNYTWIGDKLVLSSSYAGAQEIAKRLGQ